MLKKQTNLLRWKVRQMRRPMPMRTPRTRPTQTAIRMPEIPEQVSSRAQCESRIWVPVPNCLHAFVSGGEGAHRCQVFIINRLWGGATLFFRPGGDLAFLGQRADPQNGGLTLNNARNFQGGALLSDGIQDPDKGALALSNIFTACCMFVGKKYSSGQGI